MKPVVKSRKVTIKRKVQPYSLDVDLKAPKDTTWKIGAAMKGRSHLKGLTFKEETRYLPNLINVSANSQTFSEACAMHWRNISVPVDIDGLVLETGWQWKSEEDYEKEKDVKEEDRELGEPIDVSDYVLYRYCLVYGKVANSPELQHNSPRIRFYIESKDEVIKRKRTKLQRKLDAQKALLEVIGNRVAVRAVLRAWDINIDLNGVDEEELDIQLDDFANSRPDEFLKIYRDKDLMAKAFINEAIREQKLTRAEHSETIMYGSKVLGRDMNEAVGNLLSGVEEYEAIKARLEAELKFGISPERKKKKEEAPKEEKTLDGVKGDGKPASKEKADV